MLGAEARILYFLAYNTRFIVSTGAWNLSQKLLFQVCLQFFILWERKLNHAFPAVRHVVVGLLRVVEKL